MDHFFHGTSRASAVAILEGSLDADFASSEKQDGPPGFYLATHADDAEYFALRRGGGAILVVELTEGALERLLAAGATRQPIVGSPPYFKGEELVIPVELFATFNEMRKDGQIHVFPRP